MYIIVNWIQTSPKSEEYWSDSGKWLNSSYNWSFHPSYMELWDWNGPLEFTEWSKVSLGFYILASVSHWLKMTPGRGHNLKQVYLRAQLWAGNSWSILSHSKVVLKPGDSGRSWFLAMLQMGFEPEKYYTILLLPYFYTLKLSYNYYLTR